MFYELKMKCFLIWRLWCINIFVCVCFVCGVCAVKCIVAQKPLAVKSFMIYCLMVMLRMVEHDSFNFFFLFFQAKINEGHQILAEVFRNESEIENKSRCHFCEEFPFFYSKLIACFVISKNILGNDIRCVFYLFWAKLIVV